VEQAVSGDEVKEIMSTRCQVKIQTLGVESDKEAVTLYHHCDGYPSNMVPLLAGAYKPDWQHGRIGKAASYVVAEDIDGYDIESGHALHGDIEWYYVLEIKSETHVNAVPEWFLTVYEVPCDARSVKEMREVYHGRIQSAVPLAESMEVNE
jgi:hypothetical protein